MPDLLLELERLRGALEKIASDETDWGGDICASPEENLTRCVEGMQRTARAALRSSPPSLRPLKELVAAVADFLGSGEGSPDQHESEGRMSLALKLVVSEFPSLKEGGELEPTGPEIDPAETVAAETVAATLRRLARDRSEPGAALIYDGTTGEARIVVGDPRETTFEPYGDDVERIKVRRL